jgi:hypothetical protein
MVCVCVCVCVWIAAAAPLPARRLLAREDRVLAARTAIAIMPSTWMCACCCKSADSRVGNMRKDQNMRVHSLAALCPLPSALCPLLSCQLTSRKPNVILAPAHRLVIFASTQCLYIFIHKVLSCVVLCCVVLCRISMCARCVRTCTHLSRHNAYTNAYIYIMCGPQACSCGQCTCRHIRHVVKTRAVRQQHACTHN